MSFYAFTALLNAIVVFTLGFFVFLRKKKSPINQIFFFFCSAITIWSVFYFQWQVSVTESQALFWSRALMAGAVFIPVGYLHFLFVLTGDSKKKKIFLTFFYLLFSFFFISNFTPLFVKNVEPKLNFLFWPNPGILYHPFLLAWLFCAFYSVYFLIRKISKTEGLTRSQLKFILFGTIIGYLGGITNYLLWYDIPIPPVGNWTAIFYILIIAYAILKYRLLEIRIIATEFLVGLISLILLSQVITAETILARALNIGALILFFFSGYLLIRSVSQEIKRREQVVKIKNRLEKAYDELKKLDVAKTEFISIASHQLRTPLTIIKGYVSMLLEGTYGQIPEKSKKPVENVLESNERLIRLVNDLLTVSKVEAGKIEINFEKINVEQIILGLIDELRIKAKEKNLYLKHKKLKKASTKILGDESKVRQIILNVLDNGIRYTNKGGVTISYGSENGKYVIKIQDTGEGMVKQEAEKLFNSFSRGSAGTKFWTEGAGLGLYISKKFVELHKGKVWAESEGKEKGSTFYIELPIK